MPVLHLIYPHGKRISCPDAIGRNLVERLRRRQEVRTYDLDHPAAIEPGRGDVLVGHPDGSAWTVFRRSLAHPRWRRRIILCPFVHGDYSQCAFIDRLLPRCDTLLAICGTYWADSMPRSRYAHWLPRFVHLDLAIDRADFPVVKRCFNPPGRRRFVYIGHDGWYKNLGYLSAIAQRLGQDVSWIGRSKEPLAGIAALGPMDFTTDAARARIADHDFVITVGSADANPTTILEAMAWGLIPICTAQSGYDREPGVVNVPLGDADGAVAVLRRMQAMPDDDLFAMQAANLARLDQHYTWDRFAAQVQAAVEDTAPTPLLGGQTRTNRWALRTAELLSPRSYLRYHNLRRAAIRRFLS